MEPARATDSKRVVSTGNPEIDKKIGGGIPEGSLSLIEGQSDAGKSVLVQQLVWGALQEDSGSSTTRRRTRREASSARWTA